MISMCTSALARGTPGYRRSLKRTRGKRSTSCTRLIRQFFLHSKNVCYGLVRRMLNRGTLLDQNFPSSKFDSTRLQGILRKSVRRMVSYQFQFLNNRNIEVTMSIPCGAGMKGIAITIISRSVAGECQSHQKQSCACLD